MMAARTARRPERAKDAQEALAAACDLAGQPASDSAAQSIPSWP
ncbi:hypothetical protein SAMN02800691_1875 [Luteibacter sp. UNCMF366Tsu5.1]|nr:hypothetical protein SAMN02800691_1875 [Luteibacter sp. UNCMF366Tsu5.1]